MAIITGSVEEFMIMRFRYLTEITMQAGKFLFISIITGRTYWKK